MPRPVALLTDFGYEDAYAGIVKGVILQRCPGAVLIDLTHGIPPHDVRAGALALHSAVPYCPPDTLFLAVVDPGVGGARRPLCIRQGNRLFVGPDNGLLWPAAASSGIPEAFRLDRPEFWLPDPGATFHGRDIFAPCSAALASGTLPEAIGTPVADPVRLEYPAPVSVPGGVIGEVLVIDRFGNAITNLSLPDLGGQPAGAVRFEVGGRSVTGLSAHYGAVARSELLVIAGSTGRLEIAIREGSAAGLLGLVPGSGVIARFP